MAIGFPKTSSTDRKLAKHARRTKLKTKEDKAKLAAKRRDGHRCRFPLCGCKRLKLRLEVSHQQHKGMGGDPAGDRSTPAGLITLCVHRHQDGSISRHKGTLRVVPLTAKGCNGPVRFLADLGEVAAPSQWTELARETAVQQLAPLTERQQSLLASLASLTW